MSNWFRHWWHGHFGCAGRRKLYVPPGKTLLRSDEFRWRCPCGRLHNKIYRKGT